MLELRSHTLQIDARFSNIVRGKRGGGGGRITIQFFLRKADYYVKTYKRWFLTL